MGLGKVWQGKAVEPSPFLAVAPLYLAGDHGPLGSTAGNGVWEHPGLGGHASGFSGAQGRTPPWYWKHIGYLYS